MLTRQFNDQLQREHKEPNKQKIEMGTNVGTRKDDAEKQTVTNHVS